MFRAPQVRHHAGKHESNVDMIQRAVVGLVERHGADVVSDGECGNLFGVGIPLNFDSAINAGKVKAGDTVMMAGFAHAGDFAGAAAIRWGGRG